MVERETFSTIALLHDLIFTITMFFYRLQLLQILRRQHLNHYLGSHLDRHQTPIQPVLHTFFLLKIEPGPSTLVI